MIQVDLELAADDPPQPPTSDVSPAALVNRATEARAAVQPKVDSKRVTLHYRNLSGERLTLLLTDWSRHYRLTNTGELGASSWIEMHIERRNDFTAYNSFQPGSAWFTICSRTSSGAIIELELASLLEATESWLTIEKSGKSLVSRIERNKP